MSAQTPYTSKDFAEGENIDFRDEGEQWATYILSDGTTLKMKVIVKSIRRLKKHLDDGDPFYVLTTESTVRLVVVPEHLKAKPNKATEQSTGYS